MQVKIIVTVRQIGGQGGSEFQAKGTACVNQRSDSKRRVMTGNWRKPGRENRVGRGQRHADGRKTDHTGLQVRRGGVDHGEELRLSPRTAGTVAPLLLPHTCTDLDPRSPYPVPTHKATFDLVSPPISTPPSYLYLCFSFCLELPSSFQLPG